MKTKATPLSVSQLTALVHTLAGMTPVQRAQPAAQRAARRALGQANARANAAARARFERSLQLMGKLGRQADQVPQNPWPAFEPTLPGAPPRIAELLPEEGRRTLARWALASGMRAAGVQPIAKMGEPDVLEKELGVETANYRKSRLELWQSLIAARDKYRADAIAHGADIGAALTAAGRSVRGDVRVFIVEMLTHTPATAASAFLMHAPRSWGHETEVLLDGDLVPGLIARAYPHVQWATDADVLTKKVAEDNQGWKAHATALFSRLGDAAASAGELAFAVATGSAEATKEVGKGVGGLLGGLGQGLGSLPVALGIAGVGALAAVFAFRSSTPAAPVRPEDA